MRRLRLKKVIQLLLALLLPAVAVYLGLGEALRASEKPAEYIGLVFSILAASLFATISIVGDPGMLLPGSWRGAWEQAKDVQLRLLRLTYLFVLYLVVLALLVFSEIIEDRELTQWYFVHDVFAYSSMLAFILSLWLPFEIKDIQIKRLEQEIDAKRGKKQS